MPVIVRMLTSGAKESGFVPLPFEPSPQLRPVFRPSRLDASERPVLVESEAKIVVDNGLFRRDLPLALRITLSWDVDETDVDLHVLEPDGEEAYYGHRRTSSGGFMSEDVTTGYGPEEYLCKQANTGVYRILAHYYASHRQALTGAATVTATVYTDWGTAREKREILSFRLDKPRDKQQIGEVKIGEE